MFARDFTENNVEVSSDADTQEPIAPWLNEEEFLQKYCMTRASFIKVLDQIKIHPVFKRLEGKKGRPQTPVANQLMVFLKTIGTEGSGANGLNNRHTFLIGKGTTNVFCRRVTEAIMSMHEECVFWPCAAEHVKLARICFEDSGFPHCVGIANGTLFPLAFEPESVDAPDYSGRKFPYSLTMMIVCDYNRKICYYLSGFPGSAHDNQVYDAMALKQQPEDFFSPNQCNVGDSAFVNSPTMVACIRKGKEEVIEKDKELFNKKMGWPRVISEHCIGILKG